MKASACPNGRKLLGREDSASGKALPFVSRAFCLALLTYVQPFRDGSAFVFQLRICPTLFRGGEGVTVAAEVLDAVARRCGVVVRDEPFQIRGVEH